MEQERYPHINGSWLEEKEKKKKQAAKVAEPKVKDPDRWRDLTAFWFLGICNNFGFNVILTAAHDIITELGNVSILARYPGTLKYVCIWYRLRAQQVQKKL